mgnify:CR=1 FL=1
METPRSPLFAVSTAGMTGIFTELVCAGAPGSGKGTQCEKLVEEFGYTHISTGDLIRNEIKKGSRDGDRLKQFVDQGKNTPLELTVQLLINALIANPSQVSGEFKIITVAPPRVNIKSRSPNP